MAVGAAGCAAADYPSAAALGVARRPAERAGCARRVQEEGSFQESVSGFVCSAPYTDGPVIVRFKSIGNAPIMKDNYFKITASNKFQAVIVFLRSRLGMKTEPLVCSGRVRSATDITQQFTYINSSFSPAPDDTVANLFKVCVSLHPLSFLWRAPSWDTLCGRDKASPSFGSSRRGVNWHRDGMRWGWRSVSFPLACKRVTVLPAGEDRSDSASVSTTGSRTQCGYCRICKVPCVLTPATEGCCCSDDANGPRAVSRRALSRNLGA